MQRFKKYLFALIAVLLVACGSASDDTIHTISREVGSGTRTSFVEILKVIDEHHDDVTTLRAVVQNSTNSVMQLVAGDKNAIGYISLGSLNDTVKAVAIDGVEVTPETITEGNYPIARQFYIAWDKKEALSDVMTEFLTFIYTKDGQSLVEAQHFIPILEDGAKSVADLPAYQPKEVKGTIEVVGSTSVTPIMEKLGEAFRTFHPGVTVNITSNGSSAGMQAAMTVTADIGMASRELTDAEKEVLDYRAIAADGLAVIVNKDNPIKSLTLDQARRIFLGEINNWSEIK